MANEVRLIDANALIANKNLHINIGAGDNICIDIADIAKAPTIDPESLRPKGRWRLNKDGSGTCSECHRTRNDVWDMDNWDNFCSHCGAKMEG